MPVRPTHFTNPFGVSVKLFLLLPADLFTGFFFLVFAMIELPEL